MRQTLDLDVADVMFSLSKVPESCHLALFLTNLELKLSNFNLALAPSHLAPVLTDLAPVPSHLAPKVTWLLLTPLGPTNNQICLFLISHHQSLTLDDNQWYVGMHTQICHRLMALTAKSHIVMLTQICQHNISLTD